jgi:hypothetical protein
MQPLEQADGRTSPSRSPTGMRWRIGLMIAAFAVLALVVGSVVGGAAAPPPALVVWIDDAAWAVALKPGGTPIDERPWCGEGAPTTITWRGEGSSPTVSGGVNPEIVRYWIGPLTMRRVVQGLLGTYRDVEEGCHPYVPTGREQDVGGVIWRECRFEKQDWPRAHRRSE